MRIGNRQGVAITLAAAGAALLSGCMGLGGDKPEAVAAADATAAAPAATTPGAPLPQTASFPGLSASYCPELRVRDGTEVLRRYQKGHDNDPAFVTWQASIANTARQCSMDGQGNLAIKIGVSGRAIAGPKGGPGAIMAPLRIAVVKYQEAVLASQLYQLPVTIPPENSTLFSDVRTVTVPSPGGKRDYIIYVGFDDGRAVPIGNPGVAPTTREKAIGNLPDAGTIFSAQ